MTEHEGVGKLVDIILSSNKDEENYFSHNGTEEIEKKIMQTENALFRKKIFCLEKKIEALNKIAKSIFTTRIDGGLNIGDRLTVLETCTDDGHIIVDNNTTGRTLYMSALGVHECEVKK